MKLSEKTDYCELCRRKEIALTKHHAIPRTLHRNKKILKRFSKEQCITTVLWLCRPCHSHIHHILTEKQMAEAYFTIEQLLGDAEIDKFVGWIQDKPAGFKPKF